MCKRRIILCDLDRALTVFCLGRPSFLERLDEADVEDKQAGQVEETPRQMWQLGLVNTATMD